MPALLRILLSSPTLALALVASPAFAQSSNPTASSDSASTSDDSYVQFGIGADYSQGRYGDTRDTTVTSVPVSLKYVNGNFSVRVSTPFVHISGPGSLLTTPEGGGGRIDNSGPGSANSGGGSGGGGSGGGSGSSGRGSGGGGVIVPGATSRRTSGVGDTNITLAYSFDVMDDLSFDLSGKVKLPTASTAKRLGTGRADFVASAGFTKTFGTANIYVEGRRRFAGSTVVSPVRDTWGFSTGVSGRIADGVRLGMDYDWQQASFTGGQASSEITGWASFRLNRNLRIQIYGSTGFNANSVDTAGGIGLTYRFYGL